MVVPFNADTIHQIGGKSAELQDSDFTVHGGVSADHGALNGVCEHLSVASNWIIDHVPFLSSGGVEKVDSKCSIEFLNLLYKLQKEILILRQRENGVYTDRCPNTFYLRERDTQKLIQGELVDYLLTTSTMQLLQLFENIPPVFVFRPHSNRSTLNILLSQVDWEKGEVSIDSCTTLATNSALVAVPALCLVCTAVCIPLCCCRKNNNDFDDLDGAGYGGGGYGGSSSGGSYSQDNSRDLNRFTKKKSSWFGGGSSAKDEEMERRRRQREQDALYCGYFNEIGLLGVIGSLVCCCLCCCGVCACCLLGDDEEVIVYEDGSAYYDPAMGY